MQLHTGLKHQLRVHTASVLKGKEFSTAARANEWGDTNWLTVLAIVSPHPGRHASWDRGDCSESFIIGAGRLHVPACVICIFLCMFSFFLFSSSARHADFRVLRVVVAISTRRTE